MTSVPSVDPLCTERDGREGGGREGGGGGACVVLEGDLGDGLQCREAEGEEV